MRGASPKDMGTRAGHSGKQVPFRVVGLPLAQQPPLPAFFRLNDGEKIRRIAYPAETIEWWAVWGRSVLIDGFTEHDWQYLLEVATLHAQFILDFERAKMASELRQRMARFGVTPEDRAKLRIITVTADTAEATAAEAKARNAKIGMIGDGRRLTSIEGFSA